MLYVIANETAGCGNGAAALKDIKRILDKRGIDYRCDITVGPGSATDLADKAVSAGCSEIVCVGGDGTITEVINGIKGRPVRFYFVPCGTGNDFVRMLELPKDPAEAFKAQLDGSPRRIDVGNLNDIYFLNVSGSGFDAEVLKQAARFKRFGKGIIPYLLGIFAALHLFKPLSVEITHDGQTRSMEVTIFSLGNGRYFGGGMKSVPHAVINDGLFDVVVISRVNRLQILSLLAKFVSGKHTSLPQASEFRCSELTVRCNDTMTMDIDGELVDMKTAHYRLLPGALEIMAPLRQNP